MKHKHFALEEFKADDETRTIEGYGSVFGNEDSYGDVVVPGAFARTLKTGKPRMLWQHRSDQIAGVWDDVREESKGLYLKGRLANTPLGNEAYELLKMGGLDGLSIGYGTVKSKTDPKRNVRMLEELDLYEVSLVTFPANDQATVTRVKAAIEDIDGAADLIEQASALCKAVMDGSAHPTPEELAGMFQMMDAAKALLEESDEDGQPDVGKGKPATARALERYLRDAGFSLKEAKAIVSEGFTAIAPQRDVGEQELQRLHHLFNQFTV